MHSNYSDNYQYIFPTILISSHYTTYPYIFSISPDTTKGSCVCGIVSEKPKNYIRDSNLFSLIAYS